MPSLYRAVSTLCAAYFVVSLALTSIVLRAMWDSFVNAPVEIFVHNADGSQCYRDTQSTVSVFSTTTPDKAIVLSSVAEDDTLSALVATCGSFTTACQNGTRLWMCNDDGSVCLSFAQEDDLKQFLSAIEAE